MKRLKYFFLAFGISSASLYAVMIPPVIPELEDHKHPHIQDINFSDTEQLVASKDIMDITYGQMMHGMGEALAMIQKGVLTQNKLLVETGVYLIDSHPAPKKKPWLIMRVEDQESFKKTLLSYDTLLHDSTDDILQALDEKDWIKVNEKTFQLSSHCVSCHSSWKNKIIKN